MSGRRVAVALLLGALAGGGAAGAIDLLLGRRVVLLQRRHTPAEIAEARRLRDPRDPVAEIYGLPEPGPVRAIVLDRSGLVVPEEPGALPMLHVDRAAGEEPWLSRTLWAQAAAGTAIALTIAIALLLLAVLRNASGRGRSPAARSEPWMPGE